MQQQRIVVKIGSSSLTSDEGGLHRAKIEYFAAELASLLQRGHQVLLVTSGAVAAGFRRIGYKARPKLLHEKQAAAAVGQALLMQAYQEAFARHDKQAAQILLTRSDFSSRKRCHNAQSTIDELLTRGVVPIINENDTVSIDELKFGDNDSLSALVAGLVKAQQLVILTDTDGLYTDNPKTNPEATRIDRVDTITGELMRIAGGAGSAVGTGGMRSKLEAARIAMRGGVPAFVGQALEPGDLLLAVSGSGKGTYFETTAGGLSMKKMWVGFHSLPQGKIVIDRGAETALLSGGKSLLPVGIRELEGDFHPGDVVEVLNVDRQPIGRGVVNYASWQLQAVAGLSTDEVQRRVEVPRIEVIHRDEWGGGMRQQRLLNRTLREVPSDADTASHRLMLRAGLIRQLTSGVYSYLPLGLTALQRIEAIIREEMERAGAQELLLPALHPAELWIESGRWDVYGPELMRLHDRHGRQFALGATHEEVITTLVAGEISSYKKLPVVLFQIQTKFRDERRPRFGLLRGREFVMKDAYSFDTSREGMQASYDVMARAYHRIFSRCGLEYRAVEADSGAMGGKDTHEFMALAAVGEDTVLYCPACEYAANEEQAVTAASDGNAIACNGSASPPASKEPVPVSTPGVRTIADLAAFLQTDPARILKAVAYDADGEAVVVLIRGDLEVNETKVRNYVQARVLGLLPEQRIAAELRSVPGFLGPVGLAGCRLLADESVRAMRDAVAGGNAMDVHLRGVEPGRDMHAAEYGDFRLVRQGDPCPKCAARLQAMRGIEVGQVFQLGTKYSEKLGAMFTDDEGAAHPMLMGCYGIGVSRTLAAVIEQHHDEQGIVWPTSIAPYAVHLITVQMSDASQADLSAQLYDRLRQDGHSVLWDDRAERPGVKFADADLLGLPVQVRVGRKAGERIVECKLRRTGEVAELPVNQLTDYLRQHLPPNL